MACVIEHATPNHGRDDRHPDVVSCEINVHRWYIPVIPQPLGNLASDFTQIRGGEADILKGPISCANIRRLPE